MAKNLFKTFIFNERTARNPDIRESLKDAMSGTSIGVIFDTAKGKRNRCAATLNPFYIPNNQLFERYVTDDEDTIRCFDLRQSKWMTIEMDSISEVFVY